MNFVLDASTTLAWAFDDERNARALDALERLRDGEAAVASLWPLEVTHGLLAAERRGRIDAAYAARFPVRLGVPIATVDGELGAAAEAEGVERW